MEYIKVTSENLEIEHIPAENAWNPIDADGYLYIDSCALFYNGEYLTNEQMNDKRFLKLLEKVGEKKSER